MYSHTKDKKMLIEAQQMLEDARTKSEIVRMQILRVEQAGKQQQNLSGQDVNPQEVSDVVGLSLHWCADSTVVADLTYTKALDVYGICIFCS